MFTSGCPSSIMKWVASDMSNCFVRVWNQFGFVYNCRCVIATFASKHWRSAGGGLQSLFTMSSDSPCFGRAFWRRRAHWSGARQGFWLSTLAPSIQTQILNSKCRGRHILEITWNVHLVARSMKKTWVKRRPEDAKPRKSMKKTWAGSKRPDLFEETESMQ